MLNDELAPLIVPMKRKVQTGSAAFFMFLIPFGGPLCFLLAIYMLFYTRLWWVCFLYLSWVFIMDRNVEERGGRSIEWIRGWLVWKHFRDYFPARLNRAPWVDLKPEKNYLLCCFPHGIISAGSFSAFGSTYGEFDVYFPKHSVRVCTLKQNFYMPLFRELILGLGGCSASETSIDYLLGSPKGGNAVVLMPGGVAESYYCEPRKYKLVLKNRKGFIRMAMKNGSPLVPVFSFGETDIFDQYGGKESKLKEYQEFVRKVVGIAPIISIGRGIFQYRFGMVPHRRPITMLVGPPIDVMKNGSPTAEEVDEIHARFIHELCNLFEANKHFYLNKCEDIHIEII
ncbi:hypothetical protein HHI36_013305 [Cryptolaemus montrouzieri]|uniref:Acyltransferase n=1 Tax=Cryptolaemus montrouzieri TaxID=559131 RepID=A0ABD2NGY6_9CUCU